MDRSIDWENTMPWACWKFDRDLDYASTLCDIYNTMSIPLQHETVFLSHLRHVACTASTVEELHTALKSEQKQVTDKIGTALTDIITKLVMSGSLSEGCETRLTEFSQTRGVDSLVAFFSHLISDRLQDTATITSGNRDSSLISARAMASPLPPAKESVQSGGRTDFSKQEPDPRTPHKPSKAGEKKRMRSHASSTSSASLQYNLRQRPTRIIKPDRRTPTNSSWGYRLRPRYRTLTNEK